MKDQGILTDDDTETDDVIFLNTNFEEEDLELEVLASEKSRISPQFVVTLEGFHKDTQMEDDHDKEPTPPPVIKRRSIKDRIGTRPVEWRQNNSNNGEKTEELKDRIKINEKSDSRKRSLEQMEKENSFFHGKPNRVSPIKFNVSFIFRIEINLILILEIDSFQLTDDEGMSRSRSSSCDRYDAKKLISAKQKFRPIVVEQLPAEEKPKKRRHEEIMMESIKRVKKLEPSRNFDHLPACEYLLL